MCIGISGCMVRCVCVCTHGQRGLIIILEILYFYYSIVISLQYYHEFLTLCSVSTVEILNTNWVSVHYKKHHFGFLSIFLPCGLQLRSGAGSAWDVNSQDVVVGVEGGDSSPILGLVSLRGQCTLMIPLNDFCPKEVDLLLKFRFTTVLLRTELCFNFAWFCIILEHWLLSSWEMYV